MNKGKEKEEKKTTKCSEKKRKLEILVNMRSRCDQVNTNKRKSTKGVFQKNKEPIGTRICSRNSIKGIYA